MTLTSESMELKGSEFNERMFSSGIPTAKNLVTKASLIQAILHQGNLVSVCEPETIKMKKDDICKNSHRTSTTREVVETTTITAPEQMERPTMGVPITEEEEDPKTLEHRNSTDLITNVNKSPWTFIDDCFTPEDSLSGSSPELMIDEDPQRENHSPSRSENDLTLAGKLKEGARNTGSHYKRLSVSPVADVKNFDSADEFPELIDVDQALKMIFHGSESSDTINIYPDCASSVEVGRHENFTSAANDIASPKATVNSSLSSSEETPLPAASPLLPPEVNLRLPSEANSTPSNIITSPKTTANPSLPPSEKIPLPVVSPISSPEECPPTPPPLPPPKALSSAPLLPSPNSTNEIRMHALYYSSVLNAEPRKFDFAALLLPVPRLPSNSSSLVHAINPLLVSLLDQPSSTCSSQQDVPLTSSPRGILAKKIAGETKHNRQTTWRSDPDLHSCRLPATRHAVAANATHSFSTQRTTGRVLPVSPRNWNIPVPRDFSATPTLASRLPRAAPDDPPVKNLYHEPAQSSTRHAQHTIDTRQSQHRVASLKQLSVAVSPGSLTSQMPVLSKGMSQTVQQHTPTSPAHLWQHYPLTSTSLKGQTHSHLTAAQQFPTKIPSDSSNNEMAASSAGTSSTVQQHLPKTAGQPSAVQQQIPISTAHLWQPYPLTLTLLKGQMQSPLTAAQQFPTTIASDSSNNEMAAPSAGTSPTVQQHLPKTTGHSSAVQQQIPISAAHLWQPYPLAMLSRSSNGQMQSHLTAVQQFPMTISSDSSNNEMAVSSAGTAPTGQQHLPKTTGHPSAVQQCSIPFSSNCQITPRSTGIVHPQQQITPTSSPCQMQQSNVELSSGSSNSHLAAPITQHMNYSFIARGQDSAAEKFQPVRAGIQEIPESRFLKFFNNYSPETASKKLSPQIAQQASHCHPTMDSNQVLGGFCNYQYPVYSSLSKRDVQVANQPAYEPELKRYKSNNPPRCHVESSSGPVSSKAEQGVHSFSGNYHIERYPNPNHPMNQKGYTAEQLRTCSSNHLNSQEWQMQMQHLNRPQQFPWPNTSTTCANPQAFTSRSPSQLHPSSYGTLQSHYASQMPNRNGSFAMLPPHDAGSTHGVTSNQQVNRKIQVQSNSQSSACTGLQGIQRCNPTTCGKSLGGHLHPNEHSFASPNQFVQLPPNNVRAPHLKHAHGLLTSSNCFDQSETIQKYDQEIPPKNDQKIHQIDSQQICQRIAEKTPERNAEEQELLEIEAALASKNQLYTSLDTMASPRFPIPYERLDADVKEINFARVGESPTEAKTAAEPEESKKLGAAEFWRLLSSQDLEEDELLIEFKKLTFEEKWQQVLKRAGMLLTNLPYILSFGAHELKVGHATLEEISSKQFDILNISDTFGECLRVLHDQHYCQESESEQTYF